MSRPTDTERGARIALEAANVRLGNTDQLDMFPRKFKRGERPEWVSIHAAPLECLAECQALREARRG